VQVRTKLAEKTRVGLWGQSVILKAVWGVTQTDDNLLIRGCFLPSLCSLCKCHCETLFHLFFECNFAIGLWCWLATSLGITIHFQSMDDIWSLCQNSSSPQCKLVIKVAIINIFNAIWLARNNVRFNNKTPY
jgi:hypothetical protein